MERLVRVLLGVISATTVAFLGSVLDAHAATTNDLGEINDHKYKENPCYKLGDVSIDKNGYVKTSFFYIKEGTKIQQSGFSGTFTGVAYEYMKGCKNEIYFAKSKPEGKIRGVEGVQGSKAGGKFSILLEPDALGIYLEIPGYKGNIAKRYFDLKTYISTAKNQASGWQTVCGGAILVH